MKRPVDNDIVRKDGTTTIRFFSGVRVTRSLVLYVCFVGHCLSFCTFLLAIVLSVLRYTDFDYPLCYLQTPLRYENPSNQIINISVFSHPISFIQRLNKNTNNKKNRAYYKWHCAWLQIKPMKLCAFASEIADGLVEIKA
jgi:hypothetical protein